MVHGTALRQIGGNVEEFEVLQTAPQGQDMKIGFGSISYIFPRNTFRVFLRES